MSVLLSLLLAVVPQDPDPAFRQDSLEAKVRAITPRVEELRGWDFKEPVKVGVMTAEEFRAYMEEHIEQELGGPETMREIEAAYKMAGLIPPDLDTFEAFLGLLEGSVGGFYDPPSRTFFMIATFNEGALADIIMAHELTHALDDQYYPLKPMLDAVKLHTDRSFAVEAVIEGSGTSLMNLYTTEGPARGWLELDEEAIQQMMATQAEQSALIAEFPPFLVLSLNAPYFEGNKFLVREQSALGAMSIAPADEDLHRAFREPPLSSEQVLHPQKYWDPEQRDDPVPLRLPDLSAQLGEGWTLEHEDTLGELACYVATEESLLDGTPSPASMGTPTNRAATGWDGDRIQTYRHTSGATLAVWATVWDSLEDRKQFARAVEEVTWLSNGHLRAWNEASDAVVLYLADAAGKEHVGALRAAVERARPDWK